MAKKKIPFWSMRGLALFFCKREGLKQQVNVAQMQEIIGHVAELVACPLSGPNAIATLTKIGKRRQKAKKK